MAQFVFEKLAQDAGFSIDFPENKHEVSQPDFFVDSAATSREEIGNPPFPKTLRKCEAEGVPTHRHASRQIMAGEYKDWDCIAYMDKENTWGLERIFGTENGELYDPGNKFVRLLDLAPKSYNRRNMDVADPWYTGDFDITYKDIVAGCNGLLATLTSAK